MTTDSIADADTIVLIHGLWMTPRVWEHWIPRYEHRGFRVIAPPIRVSRLKLRRCAPIPLRSSASPCPTRSSIWRASSPSSRARRS